MGKTTTRRRFIRQSAAAASAVGWMLPVGYPAGRTMADETRSPNERPRVGCIGNGGMGKGDARAIKKYGDILAFCDVDRTHAEAAREDEKIGAGKGDVYEDYRKLLDRNDIDVVTISTPDHWHTAIAIAAVLAGKDVYCQKPLTLTIDEGKRLCSVVKQTGRVFQVGTQQRSEDKNRFLTAVALVREGRIGKVQRVTCAIGGAPSSKALAKTTPPAELNWDMWLGQAPLVDYIPERCHGTFRWWYEYSGGKMTDWGAHHVDIAQWAIGKDNSGPNRIEINYAEHPVAFRHGFPMVDDRFNTATAFNVRCLYDNGVELIIRDDTENGITFEGENGEFFVSRGRLAGEPVDDLVKNPIPESVLVELRKGKRIDTHMGNFIECARDRAMPVSDVFSHHRNLTTCHLANIAIRLGRDLTWNPETEQIVGDDAANAMQRREPRAGYSF